MSEQIRVRATVADDWAEYRSIRLAMLEDSPNAFQETLWRARFRTERGWRKRCGRNPLKAITVVAIVSQRWVGTASAYLDGGGAMLVAVYVVPEFRGTTWSVLDALLDAVERWAHERVEFVTLLVHEDNLRARRAYEKRGYQATGRGVPSSRNRRQTELEMQKRLA